MRVGGGGMSVGREGKDGGGGTSIGREGEGGRWGYECREGG